MPTTGIDAARLSMVIHDLRNVLNAMAMTQYCIESGLPAGDTILRDDVAMIGEGIGQFRAMLDVLSVYGHSVLGGEKLSAQRKFDPAALARDVVQEATPRAPDKRLTIERRPGAPREVEASVEATELALRYALQNAIATLVKANEIQILIGGGPETWYAKFVTPEPPLQTIPTGTIDPADVQRLIGNPRERRGMDLAIVACMCQRTGGSCRIEVDPGESSTLVLEWPLPPRS